MMITKVKKKLEELSRKGDASILSQNKRSFYLNFDRLLFSEEGIFLKTDQGEYFPIQNVRYDGTGYVIAGCESYVCSACGASYKQRPISCTRYLQEKQAICGNKTFYEQWRT